MSWTRGFSKTLLDALQTVGEIIFLDNRPQTTTVTAGGTVTARRVEQQYLFRALSDPPLDTATFLDAITALQQTRLDQDEELEEMKPRAFVEELAEFAFSHRALGLAYLSDLANGNLPDMHRAFADFEKHDPVDSSHSPHCLPALSSRLDDPEHRESLMGSRTEESGRYSDRDSKELDRVGFESNWIMDVPHPLVFNRFRASLRMPDASRQEEHIEVTCWRDMLFGILTCASPAEAISALDLGTKNIARKL